MKRAASPLAVLLLSAFCGCADCGSGDSGKTESFRVTKVEIEPDANDCVNGLSSMDVLVKVTHSTGSFKKDLDPSCRFSYDQTFTQDNVTCKATSGMCSSFSNRGKFIVECKAPNSNTVSEAKPVACPP